MPQSSEGIVLEQHGEYVKVCLERRRGCRSCALREGCNLREEGESSGFFNLFFGGKALEILALNEAGARPGDRCLVQLRDERSIVKGSFLLYLLPGALFIGGLLLGGALGGLWHLAGDAKVLAQFLGGIILMLIGFLLAALYGRRRRGEFTPIVTQVFKEDRRRS